MPGDEYNESHGGKGVPLSIWLHPSFHGDLIIILVTRHIKLNDIFELDQLSTGFDFHEKNRACLGLIGVPTLLSASYLVTILCRKDEGDYFSRNFMCI